MGLGGEREHGAQLQPGKSHHVQGQSREVDDHVQGMSFLVYMTGYTERRVGDAVGEDDLEWFQCMVACGILTQTQTAIMDPIYRLNLSLEAIQPASCERGLAIARAPSCPFESASASASASTSTSTHGIRLCLHQRTTVFRGEQHRYCIPYLRGNYNIPERFRLFSIH